MIQAARRGFLKLGTAIVGSLAIIHYAEPIIKLTKHHQWVEDKGDFLIVRVPDFKSFANETLNKPTVFLMGERSTVRGVDLKGFANIYAPNGAAIKDSVFDASSMSTASNRSVIELHGSGMIISGINVQTPTFSASGVSPTGLLFVS